MGVFLFWATLWEGSWCYIKYPTIPKTTPIEQRKKNLVIWVISIEGILVPPSDIEIIISITLWGAKDFSLEKGGVASFSEALLDLAVFFKLVFRWREEETAVFF